MSFFNHQNAVFKIAAPKDEVSLFKGRILERPKIIFSIEIRRYELNDGGE